MTTNPLFISGFHKEDAVSNKKLKYRKLGNTGMIVSHIGLGCGPMGGIYGNLQEDEAMLTVEEAIRSGINFIDTSPYYGITKSETFMGQVIILPKK
jgi:aryl-alcohol dehydrogenase-like predicted oxidoreductase